MTIANAHNSLIFILGAVLPNNKRVGALDSSDCDGGGGGCVAVSDLTAGSEGRVGCTRDGDVAGTRGTKGIICFEGVAGTTGVIDFRSICDDLIRPKQSTTGDFLEKR